LTHNFPKDCMLFVQPLTGIQCHEKLRTVRVFFVRVGHGKQSSMIELEATVKLIFEWKAAR
jgi:hypothetical protein